MKLFRIFSLALCIMIVFSLSIPAFAANEDYYFNITQGIGSTVIKQDDYGKTNQKTQANDAATIKCGYTTAPGWGFYLHLKSTDYASSTSYYWYNNTNSLRHPGYVNLSIANWKYYFIEGRFDNDYAGTYSILGKFNADYTNP